MAEIIQQRRDTAARWAQYNPVLLEGEVGYVTDNPNQYKIGDGIHAWNDLKLRGYNGTITQEKGNDENAVMSQKAVTQELSELASKDSGLGTLSQYLGIGVKIDIPQLLDGYISIDGNIVSSDKYLYSDFIKVQEEDKYIISTIASGNVLAITGYSYESQEAMVTNFSLVGNDKLTIDEVTIPKGVNYIRICFQLSEIISNIGVIKLNGKQNFFPFLSAI